MSPTRVLIVEDDAIIGMDLNATLSDVGYDVVETLMSGEESLAAIESLRPDLVLMDIKLLGVMDGISTANKIKQSFSIPVIFVTASDFRLPSPVNRYAVVRKPFNQFELCATIDSALREFKNRVGVPI